MQNFKNHARLYPLHHFILTPATAGLVIWSFINLLNSPADLMQALFNLVVSIVLVLTVLMSRIYALKNQDRSIRLEVSLRYFELTGKSINQVAPNLRLSQFIALRFADDSELVSLVDKANSEHLKSKEIKMAITKWRGDYKRV
jgi:Family of unknown function (DUF6526)